MLVALDTLLNSGSVVVYSGANPGASAAIGAGNTVLATFALGASSFGAPTGPTAGFEVATAGSIASVAAAATGNAGFARGIRSDGTTVVCDYTVSATGGSGEIQFASLAFQQGTTIGISSLQNRYPVPG